MNALIVDRRLSNEDLAKIELLKKANVIKLFTTSKSFFDCDILSEIDDSGKEKINGLVLEKILEFGNIKISKGDSIAKFFNISGANTWYYHKFRIYFLVRNLMYKIEAINELSLAYKSTILYTNQRLLGSCGLLNQEVIVDLSKPTKRAKTFLKLLKYLLFVFKRALIGMKGYREIKRKKVLFLDSFHQYKNLVKGKKNIVEFENAYLGPFYENEEKDKDIGIIDLFLIPDLKETNDGLGTFSNTSKSNHQVKKTYTETIYLIQYLKVLPVFRLINLCKILNERLAHVGISIFNDKMDQLFLTYYKSLRSSTWYYLFKFVAFDSFFSHAKAKAIVTIDENSPNYKSILDAATVNAIPTVAVQHGSIHRLHPAYRYTAEDMIVNPPPGLLFTWGEKWKNLLIESGNYDAVKIESIGQPRTDYLYGIIQQNLNKRTYLLKGNPNATKIVLFASQPQRDETLRERAALDVFKAIKELPDVMLILKMHPREQDISYYQNLAASVDCKNYKIENDLDLYILLNSSDAVITCFSTVGTEAIYLKKPLIIVDHLKQDVLEYHKDGVAFQATNDREIKDILTGIFSGQKQIDENRLKSYVTETAFKIDGKVSERFWAILDTKMMQANPLFN